MEIFVLIILYYLSQNPDFERSVKPILGELKNSQNALNFLEELSQFSKLFSGAKAQKDGGMDKEKPKGEPQKEPPKPSGEGKCESPTSGIADGFIEELLSKYFQSAK